MTNFSQVTALPHTLRSQYLASLPEPQEWFLEELVRSGEVWESPTGVYAIFQGDTLVEFHAAKSIEAQPYLSTLVQQRPFTKALCKSFDTVLMDATRTLEWEAVETAYLFRDRNPIALNGPDTFKLERARSADLADAWTNGRDFFDSEDEVAQMFRADGLWIAFNDGHPVGSGVMIPIDGSGHVVDIGMVTRPDQRNKGFASLIVSKLAGILEQDGKRPICGCAKGNLASKAALENAGFVSKHRLFRLRIPD